MRSSNGASLPFSASTDMAPATTAAASRSSAPNRPANASAVETCVPLISANPSLARSLDGASPASFRPSAAGRILPSQRTWPMPSSTALRCANGARSPEAPTGPLGGNQRIDLVPQQREQRVDQAQRDTGMSARQRIDLERQDQAHHRIRQRLAHARRVRQQEVLLQLLELLARYAGLRQQAEAGVDAVCRIAGRDDLDRPGRSPRRCARGPRHRARAAWAFRRCAAAAAASIRRRECRPHRSLAGLLVRRLDHGQV